MEIVSGTAVSEFLDRVRRLPGRYREVILCTPFLDEATISAVREIVVLAPRVRCGFRLITRREAARKLIAGLPAPLHAWQKSIRIRHRIHAKVYLAFGRLHRNSEAIITSANLTVDGMTLNEELGVRFTGDTSMGRYALAGIRSNVDKWIH